MATYNKAAMQYQRNAIQTASPAKLTLMLYDGAIKFANMAIEAIDKGDIEKANNNIIKVQNIIDDTIKSVITGNFFINPKVLKGKNISCTYCKFKDICFKTKSDEVIIGGEDDEFNA